jgi:hypothetical protein
MLMSEFLKQSQVIIESKRAKAIGKVGLKTETDSLLKDLFNDICKVVLNADDEMFVIQWAIIKLDEGERNAIKQGESSTH